MLYFMAVKPLGLTEELRVLIHSYPKIAVGLAIVLTMVVFNAIVQGMPKPSGKSGVAYQWVYASMHVLAFNFMYALKLFRAILQAKKYLPSETEVETAKEEVAK